MKIKNFEELAVSEGRRALLTIAEAGLAAVDTESVVKEMVRIDGNILHYGNERLDLALLQKIIFIAVGKCAADAAATIEGILGDRISGGVVVDVKVCAESARLKTFCGTHPLPSEINMRATGEILRSLQGLTEHDAALFVVSGGGSTLLFAPEDKTNVEEAKIFNALTAGGATIQEMNVVRRHLSLARGGNLAKAAYPARVVSLIFSDVPGDELEAIASGPTVPDNTTIKDAVAVLEKYDVPKLCPIEACGLMETPKDKKYFSRVSNALVVSNQKALEAMAESAEKLGLQAKIVTAQLTGEARDVAHDVAESLHKAPSRSVLLWGGETTVTIHGKGSGGRNRELSAAALEFVADGEEILSLASDGRDHGAAAGAICDTISRKAAESAALDVRAFLAINDAGHFFEKIGGGVMTGDTGSNVSDLIIAIKL